MKETATPSPQYCIRSRSPHPFDVTVERTRRALADEGFGILSEIDVQAKMQEKLDRTMPPYLILGACAPGLAWEVLQARPELGVLMPCNVCVHVDAENQAAVTAMEPEAVLSLEHHPVVEQVAQEAASRLRRAVAAAVA